MASGGFEMARSLIIAGVIVLALGLLSYVLKVLLSVAIPIGLALVVIGAVWLLAQRATARS
jgi:uncharacterized protein (DUF58 family)